MRPVIVILDQGVARGICAGAGIMSDPIWLQRHPVTPTKPETAKPKSLAPFLGSDILKAAERPISIDATTLLR